MTCLTIQGQGALQANDRVRFVRRAKARQKLFNVTDRTYGSISGSA